MGLFITLKRTPSTPKISSQGLKPLPISLPTLSFRNLDELLTESEQLLSIQTSLEQTLKQFVQKLYSLNPKAKLPSSNSFAKHFKWDYRKYGKNMGLKLIEEAYKSQLLDIMKEYDKLLSTYNEVNNKKIHLNKQINGSFNERDIISLAIEMGIGKKMDFLSQFLITDLIKNKSKITKLVKTIEYVEETFEEFPVDKKNCIFVIYGIKSHESEIINDFQAAGLAVKVFDFKHKSLNELKSELKKVDSELEEAVNILYTFITENIDNLMSLLLHTLILYLWAESVMVFGLPVEEYECFYFDDNQNKSNVLKKLKKAWSLKGRDSDEELTCCELKEFV
ncbi:V-type proton ATPase subunit C [Cucumispora dikerogammari]|nr:V-type proton ATPase subunit C [Cucumispora dikerogammari]